jgi:hypothetical protein
MSAPESPATAAINRNRVSKFEWISLSVLLGGFFILNLATTNLYPQVWCDEVWYSEPAVNWVTEGELHTRAFLFQRPHTFPICGCQFYTMAQAPWLSLVGTSVLGIRSFNYLLMAAAALLAWFAAWRLNLIRGPAARLLLVLVLECGYGTSFAYRCSRPDILGLTCLLCLLLSFTIAQRRLRQLCVVFFSALTVWIGLQVAVFAGFACLAAVLVFRELGVEPLALVSAGVATGAASLALFIRSQNMLGDFLGYMFGLVGRRHAGVPLSAKLRTVLLGVPGTYIDDFSAAALLIGVVGLAIIGWGRLSLASRRLTLYCLILFFGTPFIFDFIGHWAFYYSYLKFVPIAVAFLAVAGELAQPNNVTGARVAFGFRSKALSLAAIAIAIVVGLPLRLALSLAFSHPAHRSEILQVIRSNIKPGEVVLSDPAPFYEVKDVTRQVYATMYSSALWQMYVHGGHDFTDEEKSFITAIVIRPEQFSAVTNDLGGSWQAVTKPFGDRQDFSKLERLPVIGRRLSSYAAQPQTIRYPIQIFRRAAEPAPRP